MARGKALEHWPFNTYNWGRWSNDLGTLNLLDAGTTRRAFAAVRSHERLALGAPLRADDAGLDAAAFHHSMDHAGKYEFGPRDEPVQATSDSFSVAIHGMTNSHIDAFCHCGHHGLSFNGTRFEDNVSTGQPGRRFTVMDIPPIVTRAWFVDVPAQHNLTVLRPGTPVTPEDLAWLEGRIEPGDALVIRTGRYATRVVRHDDPEAADDHGNWCGLHVDCIDLIDRWDLSTVATDSSGDSFPSTTPHCSVPIHILTEVYLGLPLIHHLALETLAPAIHARGHADFMLVVAPLRITGATGSPVSPVAIL
jgi:kynurenine formamidase